MGTPGRSLLLPPVGQVIVTQMLWTRGTPTGEQGRGHPGRQIRAGCTLGDGGRGKTPGNRERETHSPNPGPAPNKVRPSPSPSSGSLGLAGRGRPPGILRRGEAGRGDDGGAPAPGARGEAKAPAPPGHCAALRRSRVPPAAIPAGGDRRRKGRFLRSSRPLPSPSADADVG